MDEYIGFEDIELELEDSPTSQSEPTGENHEHQAREVSDEKKPKRLCDIRAQSSDGPAPSEVENQKPEVEIGPNKFVIYDLDLQRLERRRIAAYSLLGSGLGALAYALVTLMTFGGGLRLGILGLAFFSAFGARLGVADDRRNDVRRIASASALFGVLLAKLVLAVLIMLIVGRSSSPSDIGLVHNPYRGIDSSTAAPRDVHLDASTVLQPPTGDAASSFKKKAPKDSKTKMSEDISDLLSIYVPSSKCTVWGIFCALFSAWDIIAIIGSMVLASIMAKPRY